MRAETRPEGREAVERVTVSGWWTGWDWAVVNQAWNWSRGEGRRSVREREPLVYCSAWEEEADVPGATGVG